MSDTIANHLLSPHSDDASSLKSDVKAAMHEVEQLSSLLPICAWCHQVRDDDGYWQRIETILKENTGAIVTHGICPDCSDLVKQRGMTL